LCLGYAETAMEKTCEQAIDEATSALLRAVNTSDLEGVMAVWDDGGTLMPPGHASVQGHQAIRAYFDELFRLNRFEFAFTSSQVSVDGALAVERVVYSATVWSLERGSSQRDRGKGVQCIATKRAARGSWSWMFGTAMAQTPAPAAKVCSRWATTHFLPLRWRWDEHGFESPTPGRIPIRYIRWRPQLRAPERTSSAPSAS